MILNRPTVLFDLDGTISDSARGILSSLRRALADHGLPPFDPATERTVLGPPFYEVLPGLVPVDIVPAVVRSYREHYRESGMFDASPFPGVADVLATLADSGRQLAIATSKPEYFAAPIVDRLGLGSYFAVVGGDDLHASRPTKADVVRHVLTGLGNPHPEDVVMVGDRKHDIIGARTCGVDCVAVRWGYAEPGELEAAGPALIVSTPHELCDALGAGRAA